MIGQLVNRVCDIFDKPSDKEVSPGIVNFFVNAINYGLIVTIFIMAYLLVTALYVSGILSLIIWVLFPVSFESFYSFEKFFETVGRFVVHYTLIGFYVLLVMLGRKGD